MTSKIITHGNSSTRYLWPMWPNYLPFYVPKQRDIVNLAKPGISNQSIAREIIIALRKIKEVEHVYIMWGGAQATDHFINGKKTSTFTPHTWTLYDRDFDWTVMYNGMNHTVENHTLARVKSLEAILQTQLLLERKNIQFTMMIYDSSLLQGDTRGEREIQQEIDWTRFKFYGKRKGLLDYARKVHPEQFPEKHPDLGNRHLHPLPWTHYQWVKQVMFQSEITMDKRDDRDKPLIADWKSAKIPDNKDWFKDASNFIEWEDDG